MARTNFTWISYICVGVRTAGILYIMTASGALEGGRVSPSSSAPAED
jgi:hypothetical protein